MTFNILDTSFSAFFSLASGMLGMAYPLIVQCIQRIDEKFHSDNLALRFRKEPLFMLFNVILVVSLLMAVFYVFFLSLFSNHVILVSLIAIQAIITVSLIVAMVLMVKLIFVYYTPSHLSTRILRTFSICDLNDLLDVCIYAAKSEDDDLFEKCHLQIRTVVYERQYVDKKDQENKVIEYPQEFWNAYRRIVKLSCDDGNPTYFYHNNSLAACLYNQFSKSIVSEQTFVWQWSALNQIADSKNKAWFMTYWTNAVSYISMFELQSRNEYTQKFKLHHVMIGTMLVYKKKYEWLKEMMSYTYMQPASYPLVPSTFVQIFSFVTELRQILDDHFGYLGSRYAFRGMTTSVKDDSVVYSYAIDYIALLMIRLWSVNDFNITYSYPMTLPGVSADNIDENEKYISITNHIRQRVRLWYKNRLIGLVGMDIIPKMADVMGLLESYIHKCEEQIRTIKQEKRPNTERLALLRQQLIDQSNKPIGLPSNLPNRENDKYDSYLLFADNKMDDEIFTVGRNISYTNYPDVLIDIMHRQAVEHYSLFFVSHRPAIQYRIQYKDIFPALKKLHISSSKYAILSMGVYLGNYETIYGDVDGLDIQGDQYKYDGMDIIPITSRIEGLVIIRKSALPFIKIVEDVNSKISLIDEKSMLYCNIDDMYKTPGSENILKLRKLMQLCYNDQSFDYALLNVTYNSSLGELDINTIKPLG